MRGTHRRPTTVEADQKLEFTIRNTKVEDADGVREAVILANGGRMDENANWLSRASVNEQLERFPEGQFVAVLESEDGQRVIGAATTMRTRRGPEEKPLRWMEMIGTHGLANHQPDGEWLYGVEIAVRPEFQRRGVASALYKVRLGLVEKLGLKGWYAGGVLMGYYRYRRQMSPREYYRRVVRGELYDPTVSMQMGRGLKPRGFIENYCGAPTADNCAALLVWQPPRSQQRRKNVGTSKQAAEVRR